MQNMQTKVKVILGACVPVIFLIALGFISLGNLSSISTTAKSTDQTRVILEKVESIVGSAVNMETGMRGKNIS